MKPVPATGFPFARGFSKRLTDAVAIATFVPVERNRETGEMNNGIDSALPPSANGFVLEVVDEEGKRHVLPAHWPAPFFAFVNDGGKPLLYHAETRDAAERFGGMLLDANFVEVRS